METSDSLVTKVPLKRSKKQNGTKKKSGKKITMSPTLQKAITSTIDELMSCPEIPDDKKNDLGDYLKHQGNMFEWFKRYEEVEIDVNDDKCIKKFDKFEKHRIKICRLFNESNEYLEKHIDFKDREDEKRSSRIHISGTKCERLNRMLTCFFNNDNEEVEETKVPTLSPKRLLKMIRELKDYERDMIGTPQQIEDDTFICSLAADISRQARAKMFDLWTDVTMLNKSNFLSDDKADQYEMEVFGAANVENKTNYDALRQSLIEHMNEKEVNESEMNIGDVFDCDEDQTYADDSDDFESESNGILTINDFDTDDEDSNSEVDELQSTVELDSDFCDQYEESSTVVNEQLSSVDEKLSDTKLEEKSEPQSTTSEFLNLDKPQISPAVLPVESSDDFEPPAKKFAAETSTFVDDDVIVLGDSDDSIIFLDIDRPPTPCARPPAAVISTSSNQS
ncbi:hypothetical protein M3Y94_01288900 [Aphelenchoides besseyi]|nr:hypothetical protein M3Y94_01288900 [Aphelenchoides besseyi]KAI6222810.1 hypothetical protein M3Y95_00933200 [Aphelenchoides besseyi]